jgi:gamma-glutamyltranspeptidase
LGNKSLRGKKVIHLPVINIYRKNLIRTLEILANADDAVKEFYSGMLAKALISDFEKNGA